MGRRRSNGEGTFFKRKDGRWAAQVSVTLPNGRTKRAYIIGRDYNTVKAKYKDALDKENRKIPYVEKEWTVAEYLDYWLDEVQANRIRETTLVGYKSTVKKYIKPALGGHKLKSLSVFDVRNALSELKKKGCSAQIRRRFMQILSPCLVCAMREELVYRNVAKLVEWPKYTPKEIVMWTVEQATEFLQAVKEHPHYIAYLLLLTYGMRRGEVIGLRWCDIDFDNGLIHVRQQIQRINGFNKAKDLKTKNSRRVLPLIGDIRSALLEHANKWNITVTKFNPYFEHSTQDTVIVSQAGTPLETRNLERTFHALRKKVGLPRIKIHVMRHIAATMLKDLNLPVKDVQLILGHSDIATTLKIYQHGTLETQHTALSALHEKLLNQKSATDELNCEN